MIRGGPLNISMGLLAARLVEQGDWVEDGLCAQVDGDLFFPEKGDPLSARQAKQVCAGCPVRTECADWALTAREPYGIWGGLTARDRKKLVAA